jgi:hypothetical protein
MDGGGGGDIMFVHACSLSLGSLRRRGCWLALRPKLWSVRSVGRSVGPILQSSTVVVLVSLKTPSATHRMLLFSFHFRHDNIRVQKR